MVYPKDLHKDLAMQYTMFGRSEMVEVGVSFYILMGSKLYILSS